jgi:hypothetical protein
VISSALQSEIPSVHHINPAQRSLTHKTARTMTALYPPARAATLLSALGLVVLIASAGACKCPVLPISVQYFKPSVTQVVRAVVLSTLPPIGTGQMSKKSYQISIKQVFKGCSKPTYAVVSTASSSAACGAYLEVGSEYLLLLTGAGYSLATNSCLGNTLFADVSEADRMFLNSRNLCCGGTCKCADGSQLVQCFRQPCSPPETAPCAEAVKCEDNYCGGCRAEWFDSAGSPACPSTQAAGM